ncbi:hypothetical protein BU24DRAFT_246642 [Aaosphaeria arxii CBS 175.79]|uniref:Uncharacterized protein n=1 Tax=Aaosphaeria arxii CBS 175.79 TaxID=1450172 RepID=A0A6A5XKI3_9PLEO|nr:uncharacterized protein BU24DRAFT_246642 [Aaosphaeria arxii CBS 175.79]KAF2013775.1 hypothetical protein BU24DRAFT_246642 [Aaosphaeria arxii CBS 175.79]
MHSYCTVALVLYVLPTVKLLRRRRSELGARTCSVELIMEWSQRLSVSPSRHSGASKSLKARRSVVSTGRCFRIGVQYMSRQRDTFEDIRVPNRSFRLLFLFLGSSAAGPGTGLFEVET